MLLANLLLHLLAFTMVQLVYKRKWKSVETFTTGKSLMSLAFLASYSFFVLYWFNLWDSLFVLHNAVLISILYPFLSKESKYRCCCIGPLERTWGDKILVSNYGYLLAGILAFISVGQTQLGIVCTITFTASKLYHLNRESRFFNLDCVFASSLLVIFSYSLVHSYNRNYEYFMMGLLGCPVAAFLLIYCGQPAEIVLNGKLSHTIPYKRVTLEIYDRYHTLWHLASCIGPMMTSYYFHDLSCKSLGHNVIECFYNRIVPDCADCLLPSYIYYVAVYTGLAVAIAGNNLGVMPVE